MVATHSGQVLTSISHAHLPGDSGVRQVDNGDYKSQYLNVADVFSHFSNIFKEFFLSS